MEKDNILLDQLEYDVIILGTSLTETILSAALAKAGKKVAHFDKNEWYGGAMTSQTLLGFKEHLNSTLHPSLVEVPENSFRIINDNLKMPIINFTSSVFQYQPIVKKQKNANNEEKNELNEQLEEIKQQLKDYNVNNNDDNNDEINEKNEENNENKESKNEVKERKLRVVGDSQWKLLTKDDRRYCLDIICNVIWSSGEDVNYFVDSGVHRYLEFKTFQNSYIFSSSSKSLQLVPASKGEIFKTKYLSLMEKRSLTRFLNFCLSEEISADILKSNFKDFLKDQKLPPKLQEFLLYAIVFQTSSSTQITTEEGINKMKNYTKSSGRFGTTPFIFPLYGNSEFPQAFSRLSAVFGSDFVLKKTINYINLSDDNNNNNNNNNENNNEKIDGKIEENEEKKDENEKKKIKNLNLCCSANQNLSTPFLVCSETYLSSSYRKVLSRAICITNKAIKDDGYLSYFVFPPTGRNPNTIFVHQFDGSMNLSPQSKYVIHFTCLSHGETAEEDLQLAVETLLSTSSSNSSEDKPKVEYLMYFNTIAYEVDEEKLPENVIVAHESRDLLIGFSYYFEQAKKIFYQICDADAEFLPPSNQINLEEELNEITHIESAFLNNNNNTSSDNNNNTPSENQSENQISNSDIENNNTDNDNNNNNNNDAPMSETSSDNNDNDNSGNNESNSDPI